MRNFSISVGLVIVLLAVFINPSTLQAQTASDWPMAGANPQRTSWSQAAGPKGVLSAEWVIPIEPYISKRVQVVAADNKIFLSTAKGLYAFDAANGNKLWEYGTSMPLTQSPTFNNGTLYVAGLDRKLHAINASNGQGLWTFSAEGGFITNPVVVNNTVYIGSRDSNMYAVHAQGIANQGQLKWKFKAGGPITTSAAYHAGDNDIYFVADDMHAYALDATAGEQTWKSAKLPGFTSSSWWPVVSGNYVYITVSPAYVGKMMALQRDAFYSITTPPASGTPLGVTQNPGNVHASMDVAQKSPGVNLSISDYMEAYPGRRGLVILNRSNGTEKTYDFDNDGTPEFAPFLWAGMTGSLTKHPPAIDPAGVVYTRNGVFVDGAIPGGTIAGWQPDSKYIQFAGSRELGGFGDFPVDEPGAVTGGGTVLYHSHCCARVLQGFDMSIPNTSPPPTVVNPGTSNNRQWRATNWQLPGYEVEYSNFILHPYNPTSNDWMAFQHAEQNPPIPYNNRVYVHRSNALIALSPSGGGSLKSKVFSPTQPAKTTRPVSLLQSLLSEQVSKIITAGHLKTGVFTIGLQDPDFDAAESNFLDVFHNIAETYIILLRALPQLPVAQQTALKSYLQSEWSNYPATNSTHLGYTEGAAREAHAPLENKNPWSTKKGGMDLLNHYAAWKYAQVFGGASTIFNSVQSLPAPLTDAEFDNKPQRLNEYIAGYKGYFELKKLATGQTDTTVQSTLNSLMAKKAAQLKVYPPTALTSTNMRMYYLTPIATNFMYLTPELADYLNANALSTAQSVIAEYNSRFPLWFVAKGTEMQGEGTTQPPHYYHGLLQAKARILKQSYAEIESFVDAPAYAVGDLYYIDNLVAAIEAGGNPPPPTSGPTTTPTPNPLPGDINADDVVNILDYTLLSNAFGTTNAAADINTDGVVNVLDFTILSNNFGEIN